MTRIGFIVILALAVAGCMRANGINHYFEYKKSTVKTEKGEFIIGLEPRSILRQEAGRVSEIWGPPYRFNAQYYSETPEAVRGEIRSFQVVSIEDGEIAHVIESILDMRSANSTDSDTSPRSMFAFGTAPLDITYRAYRVSFQYIFRSANGEILDTELVEVDLVQNKYEGSRRKGVGIL